MQEIKYENTEVVISRKRKKILSSGLTEACIKNAGSNDLFIGGKNVTTKLGLKVSPNEFLTWGLVINDTWAVSKKEGTIIKIVKR